MNDSHDNLVKIPFGLISFISVGIDRNHPLYYNYGVNTELSNRLMEEAKKVREE